MNTQQYIHQHKKQIVIFLVLALVMYFGVTVCVHIQQQNFVSQAQAFITVQHNELTDLALATIKDSTTLEVEPIIKDCSVKNRTLFDTQLGNLQQLRGQQLIEVEQLFAACGNFFAEKKAVMVLQLQSKLETYINTVSLLHIVEKKETPEVYQVASWQKLVELEKKQSTLSLHLVAVQGEIIASLRNNIPLSSDVVQTLSVEGQKTRDEIFKLSSEIDVVARQLQLL